MRNVREASQVPAKPEALGGTWVQITFTLDPGYYQKLWQRAEEEHRTISDLVHECVVNSLKE
jgi:hypothetical protein